MSALGRFFQAERIKWRKSWVLVAMVLAPVCQSGFLAVVLWFSPDLVRRFKPGFEFWIELNYLAWNILFMPILVALIADLSWDLESESKTWNLLLAQPVPHSLHYLVKLVSHLSLLTLSQVLLVLLLIPEGLLLQKHMPPFYWGPFPPRLLLQFAGYSLLASIPLIAFHTWLSTRLPGLGVALAAALGGTWLCTRAGTTALLQVVPWGMSSQLLGFFDRWHRHIPWSYFPGCLLVAGLVMGLGSLDFARTKEPKL